MGHVFGHEGDKAFIVQALDEMNEFVDDNILETVLGFFGEFEIEPDAACFYVTRAPSGFHLFDLPGVGLNADDGLPFFEQGWYLQHWQRTQCVRGRSR